MAIPVLADVAKFNRDVLTGLIDEASKATPEINAIGWRTVPGTFYNTLKVTADPVVGFRAVNTGVAGTKATYANVKIECSILNPRWECDKAVADASLWGAESFIALEAQRQMKSAMLTLASQFYYGTDADANGFPGLQGQVDADCEVDATGSTASTGSSVYIVSSADLDQLCWVLGGDGQLQFGDVRVESIQDISNNYFTAYVQDMVSWVGLQLGHSKAVVRIKNLTADSNKGLTDDLIYQALEKFPANVQPSAIFMSRRSQMQLRKSRTATNATGVPAPLPKEVEGLPIYVTEALVDTETIESSSGS